MSKDDVPKADAIAAKHPMHLYRYFLILAVAAVAAILAIVGIGLRSLLVTSVVAGATGDAVGVAAALRDTLRSDSLLAIGPENDRGLVIRPDRMQTLDMKMRVFLAPFNILKIKVFDRTGKIIYSTDATIIGMVDTENASLASALEAQPVSKLESKDKVWDLANEQRADVDVVETYVPVFDDEGHVIGAFEIYKDVTPYLNSAASTLTRSLLILGLALILVFAVLSHLMRRAVKAINATQLQLLDMSRKAGQAQVATGVLHNVGNVLNSINVSVRSMLEKGHDSLVPDLTATAKLIQQHTGDLPRFLTEDERGRHLPEYIIELADGLAEEKTTTFDELNSLLLNVSYMDEIVSTQQVLAGPTEVVQLTPLDELVDNAIHMERFALERHGIKIERRCESVPPIPLDRQRLLDVLLNLITNAKTALSDNEPGNRQLTVRTMKTEQGLRIEVVDNGVGIPADDLTRIFAHGFTTKPNGHGFGLHNSALIAQELGGKLTAHSDGTGKGAIFGIDLPTDGAAIRKAA